MARWSYPTINTGSHAAAASGACRGLERRNSRPPGGVVAGLRPGAGRRAPLVGRAAGRPSLPARVVRPPGVVREERRPVVRADPVGAPAPGVERRGAETAGDDLAAGPFPAHADPGARLLGAQKRRSFAHEMTVGGTPPRSRPATTATTAITPTTPPTPPTPIDSAGCRVVP